MVKTKILKNMNAKYILVCSLIILLKFNLTAAHASCSQLCNENWWANSSLKIIKEKCPYCKKTYRETSNISKVKGFGSEEIRINCESCNKDSCFTLEEDVYTFQDPLLICNQCRNQNDDYQENSGCCTICGKLLINYFDRHKTEYDEEKGALNCIISKLEKTSPEKAHELKETLHID